MADEPTVATINELADEEHALRAKQSSGEGTAEDNARLHAIEVELDRCWDLLRQRRAKREFHQNPDDATVRSADIVENYEN